jgi:type IV secretion system protein VirB1
MGLGQINSINLPSLGLSVDQIFDPCTNLTALQTIFLRGYNLKPDKHLTPPQKEVAAISRYNTGHPTWGVKNGYVHKVLVAKMNLSGKPVTALSVTKTSPVMVKHSIPFEITHAGIPDGFSTAIAEGQ